MQSPNSADARILLALPVDIDQLARQRPELVTEQNLMHWDEEKGTLRASLRTQIGSLTLSSRPLAKPSDEALQQAMLNWLREQGLSVLNWDEPALQLRQRLLCARQWLPEVAWPAVDDDALLASLELWLLPSLNGVRDRRTLNQINLSDALWRLLDWSQRQRLDSALPSHYTVPGAAACRSGMMPISRRCWRCGCRRCSANTAARCWRKDEWRWCWNCSLRRCDRCRSPAIWRRSGTAPTGKCRKK